MMHYAHFEQSEEYIEIYSWVAYRYIAFALSMTQYKRLLLECLSPVVRGL